MTKTDATVRRVLIVEDEAITALDLSTELTGLGYEVCGVVDTADEAVDAAARQGPNLVLLDVRLAEGGDGIEAAHRIRAQQDVAIVFLTAHSDEATLSRALEVSPFGYLIKPFRARDLKVALDLAITKHARDAAASRELQALAVTDSLTGLCNRRQLDSVLDSEWARGARTASPLAVLMIDIDHFKTYNDAHGHIAGDGCLAAVAAGVRGALRRPADVVGRWGGEEFLVILPGTDLAGAETVARDVAAAVGRLAIPRGGTAGDGPVTVSIGVAAVTPAGDHGVQALVGHADRALYAAKAAGRDCVRCLSK